MVMPIDVEGRCIKFRGVSLLLPDKLFDFIHAEKVRTNRSLNDLIREYIRREMISQGKL